MLGDSGEVNGGSDGHQHNKEFKVDPSITPKKSKNTQEDNPKVTVESKCSIGNYMIKDIKVKENKMKGEDVLKTDPTNSTLARYQIVISVDPFLSALRLVSQG